MTNDKHETYDLEVRHEKKHIQHWYNYEKTSFFWGNMDAWALFSS